jgi:tetratricopeptide (TPR) repeat protein
MSAGRLLALSAVALLLAAYGFSISRMAELRAALPPETRRAQALAVDPTLLKVASGPFRGLMADYLVLKASVFMGGAWEVTEEDWEAVYMLLKQSLHLDPLFFQTGYYIQGLLSWREGMHQKAVDLLLYHAEHRCWDWEPMFYVGFNYFFYLKDNARAAQYMRQSAERPGAAMIAATLAARLSQRTGETLTAIALLKTMYEQAEEGWRKEQYAKRLEAHLAVHQIEEAVSAFQNDFGRRPDSLDELIEAGILSEFPQNPFNLPFDYEPDTGRVYFDQVR